MRSLTRPCNHKVSAHDFNAWSLAILTVSLHLRVGICTIDSPVIVAILIKLDTDYRGVAVLAINTILSVGTICTICPFCTVMDSVCLTITESKGVVVKAILDLSDVAAVLDCLNKSIKSVDLVVHRLHLLFKSLDPCVNIVNLTLKVVDFCAAYHRYEGSAHQQ